MLTYKVQAKTEKEAMNIVRDKLDDLCWDEFDSCTVVWEQPAKENDEQEETDKDQGL